MVRWFSSSLGRSSPSMSRPLSVNHIVPSWFQVKPTVLRMPLATSSMPEPSAFMRTSLAWPGASQMLQGAPIGT